MAVSFQFTLKQYNKEPPPLSDLQYDDGSPRNIPVVVNMGFGDPSASTLEQRFLTNLTQNGQSFLSIETNSNIKSLRIEVKINNYDLKLNLNLIIINRLCQGSVL